MSSKEYIKKELKRIINVFKNIKLLYEFDELSQIHTVKALPRDFFEFNEEFLYVQSTLIEYFMDNYPKESILFVSNDSPIEITNPEFTLTGIHYLDLDKEISKISFNELFKTLSANCNFDKKPEKIAGENNYALAA
ncbi:MAG: hypothetical protein JEY96_11400 [Bacteroidales bacterium]|nr:hypothetical protein [Bacteroidales bacterium]